MLVLQNRPVPIELRPALGRAGPPFWASPNLRLPHPKLALSGVEGRFSKGGLPWTPARMFIRHIQRFRFRVSCLHAQTLASPLRERTLPFHHLKLLPSAPAAGNRDPAEFISRNPRTSPPALRLHRRGIRGHARAHSSADQRAQPRDSLHGQVEKLRYIHRNPVKQGLVLEPDQWAWSSFRWYALGERGPVLVNEQRRTEMKRRERQTFPAQAVGQPTL